MDWFFFYMVWTCGFLHNGRRAFFVLIWLLSRQSCLGCLSWSQRLWQETQQDAFLKGLHLDFSTGPLERSAVICRVDKSQDNVTFRNEPKRYDGWRVNQTTSIILLLRLLSLGAGCLVESEHSVVTVNVLAVQRMNKRKNLSDFDRVQIVAARLVDSVGFAWSFKSAAVNTYQIRVRGRMTSNWRLVEFHPRPAAARQRVPHGRWSECLCWPSLKSQSNLSDIWIPVHE